MFEQNSQLEVTVSQQRERLAQVERKSSEERILSDENERLKDTILRQSERLSQCEKEIEESKRELDHLTHRVAINTSGNTTGYHSFQSLHSSLDSVQRNRDMRKEVDKRDRVIAELEDKLRAAHRLVSDKSSVCARQEGQLVQLERQLERATQDGRNSEIVRLKLLHAEQCKELESQIDELDSKLMVQCRENEKQEMKMKAMEKEIELKKHEVVCLKQIMNDLEKKQTSGEEEAAERDERVSVLEREVKEGGEMIDQLQVSLGEYKKAVEQKLSECGEELSEKTQRVKELEQMVRQERSSMRQESRRASDLDERLTERQRMLEESSRRVDELEERQSKWERQVAVLEQEIEQAREAKTEMERKMESVMSHSASEIERLVRERDDSRAKREETERREIEEKREKERVMRDLERRTRECETERARVGELTREVESEKSRRIVSEESVKRTNRELSERECRIAEMEVDIERQRADIMEKDRQIGEMNQALVSLQNEVTQRAGQVKQFDQLLRQYKADQRQRVSQLEQQQAVCRADSAAKQAKVRQSLKIQIDIVENWSLICPFFGFLLDIFQFNNLPIFCSSREYC